MTTASRKQGTGNGDRGSGPWNARPGSLPRIGAIVLAAGYSSRMGRFKPLLPLNGSPAIVAVLGLLRRAGIEQIVVVAGHRAGELRPVAESAGVRCVLNPNYAEGMFTSVQAGVQALSGLIDAAFVLPVDIPLIRPSTLRGLIEAFRPRRSAIVYPAFSTRRGHPPLIAGAVLAQALKEGEQGPLSVLLARHETDAVQVEVADEGVLLDMDTPEEYEALVRLAGRRGIPSEAECAALWTIHNVPPQVARHSRAVAGVAVFLAETLAAKGLPVDLELVRAGALLHDLAKGGPNHAERGAELLRAMDLPEVAAIVADHTEPESESLRIDESALVFFADKLVRGEAFVGLDERFRPALERFEGDPEALAAARRRKSIAEALQRQIEAVLGAAIDEAFFDPARTRAQDDALAHQLLPL